MKQYAALGCLALWCAALWCVVIPFAVAQEELSVAALLDAAAGAHRTWRPDWPLDLPPDLFSIPGAVSIAVDFGGEEKLELVMEGERFRAFPVLMRIPGQGGPRTRLLQGRGEYDGQGRIVKISWKGGGPEAEAEAEYEGDAEVLERDGEERPVLWRIFSGGYYFAALEYGASAAETWYDEAGKAPFVLITDYTDYTDYNNEGLISAVTRNGETVSALYHAGAMPRYLEIRGQDGETVVRESYVYQWDQAGRLVRFSGGPENLDCRYEYTLDDRGNWTERRELRMELIGAGESAGPEARLVPADVKTLRRTIRYARPPGKK
jgi:hypothetical protein